MPIRTFMPLSDHTGRSGLAAADDEDGGVDLGRRAEGDFGKLMTEPFRAPGVQLDRDDPGARPDQGHGERALARPDVEDELAGADPGLRDDPRRPLMIEPVPPP